MQELAAEIANLIRDYHNYCGFQFTPQHILDWVDQFKGEDREFILKEFSHLLKGGIYVSQADARRLLMESMEKLAKAFSFPSVTKFLDNVLILRTQSANKSQDVLLSMLNEEIMSKGHAGLEFCGKNSQQYIVYIDDILATGGTVFNDLLGWLQNKDETGQSNLEKVIRNKQIIAARYFCMHTWGRDNFMWRLKQTLNEDRVLRTIQVTAHYEIENHVKKLNQRFNFAYPTVQGNDKGHEYLAGLTHLHSQMYNGEYAFRKDNAPRVESFYSSPQNRIRFENILLTKGIELLGEARRLKKNHRPLGATLPTNKMFGTGTIFFTWRNISNTCPVVFWWKSANWEPLFPLYRRGLKENPANDFD